MSHEFVDVEQKIQTGETAQTAEYNRYRPRRLGSMIVAATMAMSLHVAEAQAEEGAPQLDALVQSLLPAEQVPAQANGQESPSKVSLNLFMSPKGSDENSGLSANAPVKTLNEVQDILKSNKVDWPTTVHIGSGTYRGQEVDWRYFREGLKVSFIGDKDKRSKFVGGNNHRSLFRAKTSKGIHTGFLFDGIEVSRYWASAFSISSRDVDVQTPHGPVRRPATSGANGTIFRNMHFKDIGNQPTDVKHKRHRMGYADIILGGASYSLIENSLFEDAINDPGESLMHGVYMSHGSSNNTIRNNVFRRISGSPIKVRNGSNNNIIKNNKFIDTGIEAALYDSFQEGRERSRVNGRLRGDECSSFNNLFTFNKVGEEFAGSDALRLADFRKGGNRYPGKNEACPAADGRVRIILRDNTRIQRD